jgi:hypothetical protein
MDTFEIRMTIKIDNDNTKVVKVVKELVVKRIIKKMFSDIIVENIEVELKETE